MHTPAQETALLQLAEALMEQSFTPLSAEAKRQARAALTDAALDVLLEQMEEAAAVLKEASADGRKTYGEYMKAEALQKPSMAYLKDSLEFAAAASTNAQESALAVGIVSEAADRLAAVDSVPIPPPLALALIDSGNDGKSVFVSASGNTSASPLALSSAADIRILDVVADLYQGLAEKAREKRASVQRIPA